MAEYFSGQDGLKRRQKELSQKPELSAEEESEWRQIASQLGAAPERIRKVLALAAQPTEGNIILDDPVSKAIAAAKDLPDELRSGIDTEKVHALRNELKELICLSCTPDFPEDRLQGFLDALHCLKPDFPEMEPCPEARATMIWLVEMFNKHFGIPCGFPILQGSSKTGLRMNAKPVLCDIPISGNWQRHQSPLGHTIWSADVDIENNFGTNAFSNANFAFIDRKRIRDHALLNLSKISNKSELYTVRLLDQVRRKSPDFEEAFVRQCIAVAENEEMFHAFDWTYLHEKNIVEKNCMDALLSPSEIYIREIEKCFREEDPIVEHVCYQSSMELSARLQATLHQIRDALEHQSDTDAQCASLWWLVNWELKFANPSLCSEDGRAIISVQNAHTFAARSVAQAIEPQTITGLAQKCAHGGMGKIMVRKALTNFEAIAEKCLLPWAERAQYKTK